MARTDAARAKLVAYLDCRAFQPVLQAKPDDFPRSQRDKLAHVQHATESDRRRFHAYESAGKVLRMFKDDLTSPHAKQIHRELRDLQLPTIDDLRDEFERMARDLGVEP